jgi:hypothetical protein
VSLWGEGHADLQSASGEGEQAGKPSTSLPRWTECGELPMLAGKFPAAASHSGNRRQGARKIKALPLCNDVKRLYGKTGICGAARGKLGMDKCESNQLVNKI